MNYLTTKRFLVGCMCLIMAHTIFSQNRNSKWSINFTPLLNEKGKATPDAGFSRGMHTYNSVSLQFGINYNLAIGKKSYLNFGLQRGWSTFKILPERVTVEEFPQMDREDDMPFKDKSGVDFRYNMLAVSYHIKIHEKENHAFFVGVGCAVRVPVGSIIYIANYNVIDTAGYSLTYFSTFNYNARNVSAELSVNLCDKISVKHKQRFLIELNMHYSPKPVIAGTYSYMPYTNMQQTGTFKVSGSYIGLTLGYLFNFKKDIEYKQ